MTKNLVTIQEAQAKLADLIHILMPVAGPLKRIVLAANLDGQGDGCLSSQVALSRLLPSRIRRPNELTRVGCAKCGLPPRFVSARFRVYVRVFLVGPSLSLRASVGYSPGSRTFGSPAGGWSARRVIFDKENGLPVKLVAKVLGLQGEEFTMEIAYADHKDFDGTKKATVGMLEHCPRSGPWPGWVAVSAHDFDVE